MSSVSCDDVTGAFEELGIDLDEPKVVDLLASFCDLYKMDVDALSTEVMAFMYRRKMSATATPTLEVLDDFEKEELRKREDKRKADMARGIVDVTNLIASNVQHVEEEGDNDDEDALLSAYGATAKGDGNNKKRQRGTPEANKNRSKMLATDAGGVPFSPASFKPPTATTPGSRKYHSRANAGSVVIRHGDLTSAPSWKVAEKDSAALKVRFEEGSLRRDYRYMFESLQTKAGKLDEIICRMGEKLRVGQDGDDAEDGDEEAVDFSRPSTDPMVCLGRISSDSFDGKINAKSILLQGSQDTCEGK